MLFWVSSLFSERFCHYLSELSVHYFCYIAVNIGRGAVVDTEALIDSLESGHLGGAGLDVTDPEPLPDGHKLWTTPNVIITPHIAGLTMKYLSRSVDMLVTNAERFKKGEKLLNTVDIEKGY